MRFDLAQGSHQAISQQKTKMSTNRCCPSHATLQVKSSETDTTYRGLEAQVFALYICNSPTQGNLARLGLRQCPYQSSVLATFRGNCEQLHSGLSLLEKCLKYRLSRWYQPNTTWSVLHNHTIKPLYELLRWGLTSYGTELIIVLPETVTTVHVWLRSSVGPS